MMFCPKCKSILRPKKEGEKTIWFCSCGYTNAKNKVKSIKEEERKVEVAEMEVVDKEVETLPITTDDACPECGNREAHYWMIQTRAGDEPETKFMKCTKCKHTWRDYS